MRRAFSTVWPSSSAHYAHTRSDRRVQELMESDILDRSQEASMDENQGPAKRRIPPEAVDLYTRYIHGEVSRRDFLKGINRFTVAGLSAAAIVEALMPNYALGQQVRKDDERITASYETIPSPNGNGKIRGYFVRPFSQATRSETPTRLPAVLVIHENRGLNPHTEDVAR